MKDLFEILFYFLLFKSPYLGDIHSIVEKFASFQSVSHGKHILDTYIIYLYHGAWANQRVLPWYNYNTPQWLVVIPRWPKGLNASKANRLKSLPLAGRCQDSQVSNTFAMADKKLFSVAIQAVEWFPI